MRNKLKATGNSTEKFLVQCLSNLLQVPKIGLQDHLFTLGLDSVLAAMFINRIRDEFNVELPISKVFETPTIHALALAIQNLQDASGNSRPEDER
ncbi:MAG: acyl carrier protein [Nitrospirales bacterium]